MKETLKKELYFYKIEQDTYLANLNMAKELLKTAQANFKKNKKIMKEHNH